MRCKRCDGRGKFLLCKGEFRLCRECEGTGRVKRFIEEFVSGTALSLYLQKEPHPEYRLAGCTADKEVQNGGILVEGYKLIWERKET